MKKYKLIKEYPGSPELGTILKEPRVTSHTLSGDCKEEITESDSAICFNEFWEEVVEKDYEILEINGYSGRYFLNPKTGYMSYGGNGDGKYNAEYYLNSSYHHYIVSVKRLSDGEIFTVGDKIQSEYFIPCNEIRTIQKFKIISNTIDVEQDGGITNLNNIKKAEKPLFTTEDGVDIYEGDKYFQLALTFYPVFREAIYEEVGRSNIIYSYAHKEGRECLNKNGRYYFSTKEAAEEYILMNKPCLSIKEITPIVGKVYEETGVILDSLTRNLKTLVKSKL